MYKPHAPVINPFDKLSQGQFDNYISNIQSKIQLALNPPTPEPLHVSRSIAEISGSTIASPAPPSKRSSVEPHASTKTYAPSGAGTPNDPYELSDDDEEENKENDPIKPPFSSGSESEEEEEPEPLSAIPEDVEEVGEEEIEHSGSDNDDGEEEPWDYSGEDASEDELEASGSEEAEQDEQGEQDDVFIGKGKGRHPAEGPGLVGLLNGSGIRGDSSRALDDSFEQGASRRPTLGITSTPFISRTRSRSARPQDHSGDEGSPPWEPSQGLSMPPVAYLAEDEGLEEDYTGLGDAPGDAIEVLDSDEELEPDTVNRAEFDELQFEDSAIEQEPDSLFDDTVDLDGSIQMRQNIAFGPSSLFSGSSYTATREPSAEKDESADTVQAPQRSFEESDNSTAVADEPELEPEQASIQRSMDYSDFIGEHSLGAQQDTSQLQEVTIYELEDGSRYYDYDGVRHFLDSEGVVVQTAAIPPPRPTIQQMPDLSMIEEVTEYDITRRMVNGEDEADGGKFNFLDEMNDTFSSVGELRQPGGHSFEIDDIPQRPGAALGFTEDSSAFLEDSAVFGIHTDEQDIIEPGHPENSLVQLGPQRSISGMTEEPLDGRNAEDLVSDDDLVSASSDAGGGFEADESRDSILDDDDDDDTSRGLDTRLLAPDLVSRILEQEELDNRLAAREDMATPVPPKADESELQLDEKSMADLLAQLAESESINSLMNAGNIGPNVANNSMLDVTPDLDSLINGVPVMSTMEEDMLARSFTMADNVASTALPLDPLPVFGDMVSQILESTVESSILGEIDNSAFQLVEDPTEKLVSDVLVEAFEGAPEFGAIDIGPTAPSDNLGPAAKIEQIEVSSRPPTPKRIPTESLGPSPHRTPATPPLSAGQSPTAPELSIATSISGRSGVVPNVYEGSPTSSTPEEGFVQVVPESTELPDPALPPSPTHLSMPAVPTGDVPTEVSPSVVVEPPTPYTSEGGKPAEIEPLPVEQSEVSDSEPEVDGHKLVTIQSISQKEDDEDADTVSLPPPGTPSRELRRSSRSPGARSSTKEYSPSPATPTSNEKLKAGDKRKRLEDARSPTSAPLKLDVKSPDRLNSQVISPTSETGTSSAPAPRESLSSFRRTPTSVASGTTSRKTSGSDSTPAPWPAQHRVHRHAPASQPRAANSSTGSVAPRSNCRFHKVTMQADGRTVTFIVPACALGSLDVLKEHKAEDCGLASTEDESGMVTDVGDIEAGVAAKLKSFVGAALFDEGVCGYLPTKHSRPTPERLKGSLGRSTDFKFETIPEHENKAAAEPTKLKPRSRSSVHHNDRLYKTPTENSESDDSAEEEHARKRPKHKKRDSVNTVSSIKFPSLGQDSPEKPRGPLGSQQSDGRTSISRRMKRARRPADAQAYKPDPNQEESSSDETKDKPRKRSKRAASVLRRTNSSTPVPIAPIQESKQAEEEVENPFKPKYELKRLRSPEVKAGASSVLDKPSPTEQKQLEQHVQLGDHPGEVVDETGKNIDGADLADPAPAKVAVHVDREAPSRIGDDEPNGAGENALGANNVARKGFSGWVPL